MEVKNKISFHHLFWYFIIFSVLGLLIETLFCYITMGIIESRKGLLYGPFCPIYGIGAACLIYILDKYKNNNKKIFIYGAIAGSVIEYVLSFGLEAIYGSRFWDYAYKPFNLNGRICLTFSIYWGVLAIILVKWVKPIIDKLVDKIKPHTRNIVELGIFIFLVIDGLVTIWGIQTCQNRVVYNKVYKPVDGNIFSEIRSKMENEYFTNERMSTTFPNLRIKNENGDEVWIKTLIKD